MDFQFDGYLSVMGIMVFEINSVTNCVTSFSNKQSDYCFHLNSGITVNKMQHVTVIIEWVQGPTKASMCHYSWSSCHTDNSQTFSETA